MDHSATKLRPLFRPFVIRPTLWMSAASVLFTLAYFAIWDDLYLVAGGAAWAGPALFLALPILLLFARIIAYRGTHYTIGAERISVHRGGVFGDRSIELDLVNITLVEWRSPYLLKLFYGVGHIIIQEAGNAAQNARLVYLEDPQQIYRLIAKNMRGQGFSMQRNARICQQKSGILGAFVDMTGVGVGVIYSLVIIADTAVFVFGLIITNIVSSLRPLTQGAGEQIKNIEILATVAVFGLSGLFMLASTAWLVFKFIELTRRTLTLHDDVVDYYEGFLSEKRQFIPLENLTDTDLIRPLYKRILGLSDLRISSRGAGSNLMFNSMPGAEEFAGALERQLDKMSALKQTPSAHSLTDMALDAAPRVAETRADAPARPLSRTYTFKPEAWRAAAGSLIALLSVPLVIFAGMGLFAGLSLVGVDDLGAIGVGLFGTIAIWGSIWLVSTLFTLARSVLYAQATEYSFDARRARKTFDLLNRQETKFATEQITSFSVLTNPIDRILGTMTLRLRSLGSAEPLDFKFIAHDPALLVGLQKALGFKHATPPAERRAPTQLNPTFTLIEGLRRHIAGFLGVACAALSSALIIGLISNAWVLAFSICLGAPLLLGLLIYTLWQSLRVGRLHATLDANALTVEGGVLQRFHHHTTFRHIKGVDSLQHPGSDVGQLNISTGGGFAMRVDFLPAIRTQHDRIDSHILDRRVTPAEASDTAELHPNIATALTRHCAVLLLPITILTLPFSLAWVAFRAHRTRYRIENERIIIDIPLIFHRRTSVLFKRIDHLESSRNLANKLFNTRDIEVYTVGSSTVDLELRSLKDHKRALSAIRNRMTSDTFTPNSCPPRALSRSSPHKIANQNRELQSLQKNPTC